MILPLLIFAQVSGVQIHTTVTPQTAYVGQQVSYDVGIRMNVLAQTSFQSNPEYSPPDVTAATTYDFPFDTASIKDVKTASGLAFREFLYHRGFFPLTPGKFTIPAPALTYTLPDEEDPFSTPKEYSIKGTPVSYTVIPVPDAGKPADFAGAVGQFTAVAAVEGKTSLHVGESFILTMTVTGDGNINLLPRPPITIPWARVTNSKETPTWDSTGTKVHGSKMFQWIINPTTAGAQTVPALRYAYFNPETKQYAVAMTAPLPITVEAGTGSVVQKHDASTSPFPAMMQWIGANILWIVLGLVVVGGLIFGLVKLARNQEPID